MAEAYDAALRRRLDLINNWGAGQTDMAAQSAPKWATNALAAGGPGMRDGVFRGAPMRDGVYNGPRGNQAALIAFGKMIQGLGGRVGENSFFNGGHRITGGHVKGSKHYSDHALDINFGAGTSKREQRLIDKYLPLAAQYGLHSIWRQPGHFNHWHVDY